MYVDAEGKVRDGDDPANSGSGSFDPIGQGHRLSDDAERKAGAPPPAPDIKLPSLHLPHLELPSIPTGAYVVVGLLGVTALSAPLVLLYLVGRGAKAVGQAAIEAAPAVAAAGPAILPFVPEAAPVVAAASIASAVKSSRGGAPSSAAPSAGEVAQNVLTLLQATGMVPSTRPTPVSSVHPAMASTIPPSSWPSTAPAAPVVPASVHPAIAAMSSSTPSSSAAPTTTFGGPPSMHPAMASSSAPTLAAVAPPLAVASPLSDPLVARGTLPTPSVGPAPVPRPGSLTLFSPR